VRERGVKKQWMEVKGRGEGRERVSELEQRRRGRRIDVLLKIDIHILFGVPFSGG